ncbi:MAG: replicative DNA helicase, partial [Gammaproteobacteria bacterium]
EQEARGRRGYRTIKDLLVHALDRIDALFQQDNPITGVPTGFDDLDKLTAGLQPSDLIIVAGRPSMGKTSLAINIAEHAAIKHKLSVAIFSMESPGEQLAMRMMSSLGRIDQHKVRSGKLDDEDWPRLTSAVGILSDAKLFIDDTAALTPGELRSRCRRLFREHGLDLIVVDYLQLMEVPGTKENRATEISEISRSLKALAKELNVPVLALSQLNRSLEQRPNKRPLMSDLRESGAIEQDADVIVFIYRDEVYDEESPQKGLAEIIVGKQRNGPIGTIALTFLGQYTRFENYVSDSYTPVGDHE